MVRWEMRDWLRQHRRESAEEGTRQRCHPCGWLWKVGSRPDSSTTWLDCPAQCGGEKNGAVPPDWAKSAPKGHDDDVQVGQAMTQ